MGIARKHGAAGLAAVLIIVAGCSSSPRFAGPSSPAEPAAGVTYSLPPSGEPGDTGGNAIVRRAADYLGTPYRNGGTTTKGVDCSGLTWTVYRSFGISLPRTSREQAGVGTPVPRNELTAGDLIFFGSGNTISHVGIYAGDGEFIHASTRSRSVRFDRLDNKYFRKRYVTARRVL